MKAILVIDFLNNRCDGCPCFRDYRDSFGNITSAECSANGRKYLNIETFERPSWCPLRPFLLGEELRKFRNTIKDERTLIGFNMAVAICNKHLGENNESNISD